jgi:hypothetical protein
MCMPNLHLSQAQVSTFKRNLLIYAGQYSFLINFKLPKVIRSSSTQRHSKIIDWQYILFFTLQIPNIYKHPMDPSVQPINRIIPDTNLTWDKRWYRESRTSKKTYLLKVNPGTRAHINQKVWQKTFSEARTNNLTHAYNHFLAQQLTSLISSPNVLNLKWASPHHRSLSLTVTSLMVVQHIAMTSLRSHGTQQRVWSLFNK